MDSFPPGQPHVLSRCCIDEENKTTDSFLLPYLLVLYEVAFYDMKIATVFKLSLGLTFLILTAIGFAISTQVRCMVLLIVPVFLGKEGRSMLSAAAVQYLVKG